MLFSFLAFLPLLFLSALASIIPRQAPKGTIVAPLAETPIAPGSNFTFQYFPRADYGVSTFAIHVFLLDESSTESPVTISPTDLFSSGYYFGRYDYANYPADPFPTHPAPSQLTMPDFSQAPGGFASGATGSNVKMQLVVVEEYGGFSQVGLGFQFGMAVTEVIYNATSPA